MQQKSNKINYLEIEKIFADLDDDMFLTFQERTAAHGELLSKLASDEQKRAIELMTDLPPSDENCTPMVVVIGQHLQDPDRCNLYGYAQVLFFHKSKTALLVHLHNFGDERYSDLVIYANLIAEAAEASASLCRGITGEKLRGFFIQAFGLNQKLGQRLSDQWRKIRHKDIWQEGKDDLIDDKFYQSRPHAFIPIIKRDSYFFAPPKDQSYRRGHGYFSLYAAELKKGEKPLYKDAVGLLCDMYREFFAMEKNKLRRNAQFNKMLKALEKSDLPRSRDSDNTAADSLPTADDKQRKWTWRPQGQKLK